VPSGPSPRRSPPAPTPSPRRRPWRRSAPRTAKEGTWTFNLDVGLGAFGFANSCTPMSGPDPSGDLERQLGGELRQAVDLRPLRPRPERASTARSAPWASAYAAPAPGRRGGLVVQDRRPSLGWRSGTSLGTSENSSTSRWAARHTRSGTDCSSGTGRRRGQPRRLLEQRAQGLGVRGRRPLRARDLRGLLPRSRRGPGE
jgi:hypothetical protein